ncbi:MAG: hypothetical protein QOG94_3054 [Solirubrobacteraceae bacterium]|jgi:glycosyltransferase involved in cell wall biosynthesis|nr:hypothetical protein [Solirubrobacteraceae bacterium]
MTSPLVSVIVPVHNGRAFIGDALRSVFGQAHRPIECIVVDDGSTDGTAEVVAAIAPDAICIRQARGGVSAARNAGAAAAAGDLLAFLDADDVWLPEKLTLQVRELARSPYPMVMCGAQIVDADLRPRGELRMALPAAQPLLGMVVFGTGVRVSCSSTALMTRAAFGGLDGFDANLSTSADWDLLARFLLAFGGVAYVDRPLIKYRMHAGGMSRSIAAMEHDMRRAYDELFARAELPPALRTHRREAYASMRLMLAGSYWQVGARTAALRNAGVALAWRPRVARRLLRGALAALPRRGAW